MHDTAPISNFDNRLLSSPEETTALAAKFAEIAHQGDVICLDGDLGAGKTHFARSLIQNLQERHGRVEDVPSPSFTLIQTYIAGDLEIWHADLYRLSDPMEVEELGLFEAFENALCLVEWPDRLGADLPHNALILSLKMTEKPGERVLGMASANPDIWFDRLGAMR